MTAGEQSQAPHVCGLQWSPCGRAVALVIGGRLARADIPELCMRLESVFGKKGVLEVACDVGGIVDADAVAVDALARLQLTARRWGRHVRLRNVSCGLRELIGFAGLRNVLPDCSDQRSAGIADLMRPIR